MAHDIDTLILPIKVQWFDMIASGKKKEEYRKIKSYWTRRLCFDGHLHTRGRYCNAEKCDMCSLDIDFDWQLYPFKRVTFRRGYLHDAPSMTFKIDGKITMDYGKPKWGAPKGKLVYVIKLGKRIK